MSCCNDCNEIEEFNNTFEEGIPYTETKLSQELYIRVFDKSVNSSWLKWHWDEEDRVVVPLHSSDWLLQFDDELPIKLTENHEYHIKAGRYHRIIKGTNNLKIIVKKVG